MSEGSGGVRVEVAMRYEPMDPKDLQALIVERMDEGATKEEVEPFFVLGDPLAEDSEAFKAQEEHFRRLHPEYMAAEDQGRHKARRA